MLTLKDNICFHNLSTDHSSSFRFAKRGLRPFFFWKNAGSLVENRTAPNSTERCRSDDVACGKVYSEINELT